MLISENFKSVFVFVFVFVYVVLATNLVAVKIVFKVYNSKKENDLGKNKGQQVVICSRSDGPSEGLVKGCKNDREIYDTLFMLF